MKALAVGMLLSTVVAATAMADWRNVSVTAEIHGDYLESFSYASYVDPETGSFEWGTLWGNHCLDLNTDGSFTPNSHACFEFSVYRISYSGYFDLWVDRGCHQATLNAWFQPTFGLTGDNTSASSEACRSNDCYLKVDIDSAGSVTESDETGWRTCGTPVTLTATPASGWEFTHWSGELSTTSPTIDLYADEHIWVTAHFALLPPPPTPPPPQDPTACHNCGGGTNPEPLVLDLDGDGIATSGVSEPIRFDLDGDGNEEWITWLAEDTQDGFLWLDLEANMTVDGGQELFGIGTVLPDGSRARDGFEALTAYDSPVLGGNGDSKISSDDAVWARLRVWVDQNHDGISQVAEIASIHEYGVMDIYLSYTVDLSPDAQGNLHLLKGEFLKRITGDGAARYEKRAVEGIAFQFIP